MENKLITSDSLLKPLFKIEEMYVWPISEFCYVHSISLDVLKEENEQRRHFLYDPDDAFMFVDIGFRAVSEFENAPDDSTSDINTRLLVAINDAEGQQISSCEFPMTLPYCGEGGFVARQLRLGIPLQFDSDDKFKDYIVEVIDLTTSQKLASSKFTIFDSDTFANVFQIYRCRRAAIFKQGDDDGVRPYRSVAARMLSGARLRVSFVTSEPENLRPELEVHITTPSEKTHHCFVTPVDDDPDSYYNPDPFDHQFPVYIDIPWPKESEVGEYKIEVDSFDVHLVDFTIKINKRSLTGYYWEDEIDFSAHFEDDDDEDIYDDESLDEDGVEDDGSCGNNSSSEPFDETFSQLIDDFIKSQREKDSGIDSSEKSKEEEETDARLKLDTLVGMTKVKERIEAFCKMAVFNKRRSDLGCKATQIPLHTVFLGSPGTGKTTVAHMLGKLLHQAGVLSRGHVVVRERSNLLGQNYNSESENTLKALEEAEGGILFIDEAYQLYQPNDPRDPGKFVLETLMTALSDEKRRDWMLILSGYAEPIEKMLKMNVGLSSRIPECNRLTFDDYSIDELMKIADRFLINNQFVFSEEARNRFAERVKADYESRDDSFGNARHVLMIIETEILPAMAIRTSALTNPTVEQLSMIDAADIPASRAVPAARKRTIGFMHN